MISFLIEKIFSLSGGLSDVFTNRVFFRLTNSRVLVILKKYADNFRAFYSYMNFIEIAGLRLSVRLSINPSDLPKMFLGSVAYTLFRNKISIVFHAVIISIENLSQL